MTKRTKKPAPTTEGKPPAKAESVRLPPSLHKSLALQLRHTQPFGRALTRALNALDEDDPAHDDKAAAILQAVEITPSMLAEVKHYSALSMKDVKLAIAYFDGEENPFAVEPSDLAFLPNLETLNNMAGLPEPPTDVAPLLELPKLRRLELVAWTYALAGTEMRQVDNVKARAQLEAAGFKLTEESNDHTWVFER